MGYNVTVQDVESRWRALSPAEAEVAKVFIADLESDLDLHRPTLTPMIENLRLAGDDASLRTASALERSIQRIIASAVKRALRNPDVFRFTNLTADGGIHVGFDNSTEGLGNAEARLTAEDFADVDSAMQAAGAEAPEHIGSVRLSSSWASRRVPDITKLPLP